MPSSCKAMETAGIVSELIDVLPQEVLKVVFADNHGVKMGEELLPGKMVYCPVEISWAAEPEALYTLALIDPHPAADPQVIQWLVNNIPGTNVDKGDVVAPYWGPRPFVISGVKPYIFLVYKQQDKLEHQVLEETRDSRHGFNIRDYAAKNNLGQAVAGNFLITKADDYCVKYWAEFQAKEAEAAAAHVEAPHVAGT